MTGSGRRKFLAGLMAAVATPASAQWAAFQVTTSYAAQAVHFDGSTYLSTASLTTTNNGFFSFSWWGVYTNDGTNDSDFAVDPVGIANDAFAVTMDGVNDGQTSYIFADTAGTKFLTAESAVGAVSFGTWHHICGAVSTNLSAGSKIALLLCDGVSIATTVTDVSTAFVNDVNGRPFFVGHDNATTILGDRADIWIAPGQFVDFSDAAVLAKFRTVGNRPVFLGATGSIPTGTSPAIFFSGNAATFATNKGTGGAFITTGTLTNAGFVT